jgi:CPA1 family monovalent cation:H+ antiporter
VTELDHHDLAALLMILVAGAAMIVLVPKLRVPYPILLVVGGLALGFVPGVPEVELSPELILVGILPPLLYGAAFFTSLRDLRANVRPVTLLSVGLVLLTMVVVAVVAHELVGLPWAAAFVLGAVVSPTDPIAATAIMQRLGVPRRIVSVVEGESLVNDGTALVALRFAVAAALTGTFSLFEASASFVLNVAGGVAVGLAVGWIVRQVRRRLDFPVAEVTISLLTGYFAFIPAELLGVSAVIAAVTSGIYLGWYTPELTTPEVRLMGESAWEIVTFLLNAVLFTLIGLQLPVILDELDAYATGELLWWAVAVWLTVLVVRALWVYPAAKLPRLLVRRIRERDPMPTPAALALVTWSGMRGAVSLAAALAVPLTIDTGEPFPGRSLILFLTFAVILGSLVVQGLTLPAVIRLLRLEDDGQDEIREEAEARIHAAAAALLRLDELEAEEWVRTDTAERVRGGYNFRRDRFSVRLEGVEDDGSIEARSQDFQRLRRELLNAERAAVLQLSRGGRISEDVARRVLRDLDLEDARLEMQ